MIFLPFLIVIPLVWFLWSPERRERISSAFNGRKSPLDIVKERYARG